MCESTECNVTYDCFERLQRVMLIFWLPVLYLYFVPFIGFQIKYDDDDDDVRTCTYAKKFVVRKFCDFSYVLFTISS